MKKIEKALAQYWGFETFLPLQRQAMECISRGTDSVVVLPTGGGKSLCFQAPAVTMPGLAVVVSPLISLMKDQVDALKECGVAAEYRAFAVHRPLRGAESFWHILFGFYVQAKRTRASHR